MATYIALIHKDADSDYGVSFPDLPGCVSAGTTLQDALDMAAEALALHLRGMREDNEPIPPARDVDAIVADEDAKDAVLVTAVRAADPPERTVRVNITLPEETLREIDAYAEANGFTRSGFLVRAARQSMAAASRRD